MEMGEVAVRALLNSHGRGTWHGVGAYAAWRWLLR